jgi:hypothetical protein
MHAEKNYNSIFQWHKIWLYYDWVVVVVRQGRQQRQPNHNTTTYCVYWRTKTTTTQSQYDHLLCLLTEDNDNPIIMRTHIVLTDWRQQPNHNTITCCQYVVVLWLGCHCRPSVNTICGRIMIGLSLSGQWQPNHNTTTYCVYWRKKTTTQS